MRNQREGRFIQKKEQPANKKKNKVGTSQKNLSKGNKEGKWAGLEKSNQWLTAKSGEDVLLTWEKEAYHQEKNKKKKEKKSSTLWGDDRVQTPGGAASNFLKQGRPQPKCSKENKGLGGGQAKGGSEIGKLGFGKRLLHPSRGQPGEKKRKIQKRILQQQSWPEPRTYRRRKNKKHK